MRPTDPARLGAAAAHHLRLTKPPGALGRLESLGCQLSAIAEQLPPPIPSQPAVAIFAGDHGVLAEGVSPWPQEVTAQMVANFCAGGAAINVLARRIGASVTVVDVGVATEPATHPALQARNIRRGTANLAQGAALEPHEALGALLVGAEVGRALVAAGADLLVGGEMGIGNTTPSAALIGALTGASARQVTGRGTGIDDATWARKTAVVAAALIRVDPDTTTALNATVPTAAAAAGIDQPGAPPRALVLLAEIGGLEIAALTGFYLAGAAARVPVVLDGVISLAAACVAASLRPAVLDYLVAGHRSSEPGAGVALSWLGLEPLIDMGLRLGEGTGAALAVPMVQAAAAVMGEMATFDSAGVQHKAQGQGG